MKERTLLFFFEGRANDYPYSEYLQLRSEAYGFTLMDEWDINNQDHYHYLWGQEYQEDQVRKHKDKQLDFRDMWGTQHLETNRFRAAFKEAGYAPKYS